MKLRRAMAAAAATAVIAPLTLLAAPAAYATDPEPSASATESAPAPVEPSPSASVTKPAEPAPSTSASESAPAPSASASATASTPPAPSASASASASTSASASASTSASASASSTATTPSDWDQEECPTNDEGIDEESALELSVSGLPGKIVAGSGWHGFTLNAANTSDKALGEVQWFAGIDGLEDDLASHVELQVRNPATKAWESLSGDELVPGLIFGATSLDAKKTVAIELRVDIDAKAPAGESFALGFGGYLNEDETCVHTAFAYYGFEVLAAGSDNENPGEAKPTNPPTTPAPNPQGSTSPTPIPATGELAETGSESSLPVIGMVGGVTILAGAGVVFAMRRRSANEGSHA
ncbi:LPXTG cell wall anchor domain-containing protein [Streptomyces sp. NPDC060194]|uniref:LPXTG cell wall anchor domain-containing protein n=1 Tax=Streptomyces sp. NPDC060194 TaxID=3347069 RepID=UPI0036682394